MGNGADTKERPTDTLNEVEIGRYDNTKTIYTTIKVGQMINGSSYICTTNRNKDGDTVVNNQCVIIPSEFKDKVAKALQDK